MALVGSLVISLSAQTQPFQQGIQSATLTIKGLQSATVSAQGSISGFGAELGKLTAGYVTLQKLKDAFVSLVQAGRELELLRATLGAVFGGSQEGAAALQRVSVQANRLGVDVKSLGEAYRGFSAAAQGSNLEGARAEKVFQQLTSAGRVMGLTTDNLQSVLLAFQQIISKGTVTAEELRGQIGERWPGAMRTAANAMGITEAALNKMMQRGELLANSFIVKFGEAVERQWSGKGREALDSFDAHINRLSNSWQNLGSVMMSGAIGDYMKQVLTNVRNEIDGIAMILEKLNALLGNRFKAATDPLGDWAETEYQGGRELPMIKRMKEADEELLKLMQRMQKHGEEIAKLEKKASETGQPVHPMVGRYKQELTEMQTQADKLKARMAEDKATFEAFAETARASGRVDPKILAVEDYQIIIGKVQTLWDETMTRLKEDPENAGKIWREYQNEVNKLLPILDAMKAKLADISKIQAQGKLDFLKTAAERRGFEEYGPMIASAAKGRKLDPNLMVAMAYVENKFRPQGTSEKGAQGLMQIMPDTALGLGFTPEQMKDPTKNIEAAMKLMKQLEEQFGGNLEAMIQAYHAGPNKAEWGPKTKQYLQTVLEIKAALDRVQMGEVDPMVEKTRKSVNDMRDFAKSQITTIGDFDAYLRQLGKSIEDYYQRILSPEEFEQQSEKIRRSIEDTQTHFRKQFATDPKAAQAGVGEMMGQFQGLKLDVETAAALAENRDKLTRNIDDMLNALEAEHRQLTMNKDAFEEYTLAVGNATPGQLKRYEKVKQESLDYNVEKAVEGVRGNQQKDVDSMVQSLEAERAQLTGTSRAYLEYQLAAKAAEDSDRERILSLHDQVEGLKRVQEVAGFMTQTFEQLLFDSDATFKEIALSFGRMIFQMLMSASNVQQNLGNLLMKGVNAALGAVGLAGGVPGGGDTAAVAATSVIPGKAAGGPVMPGRFYRVGEKGPELFIPKVAGTILPNGVSPQQGGGPVMPGRFYRVGDPSRQMLTAKIAEMLLPNGATPRQGGGPVLPGRFYRVGEKGPEHFSPSMAAMGFPESTEIPTGALPTMTLPPMGGGNEPGKERLIAPITMHITTPNPETFMRSRAEVESSLILAMQRAQRNV